MATSNFVIARSSRRTKRRGMLHVLSYNPLLVTEQHVLSPYVAGSRSQSERVMFHHISNLTHRDALVNRQAEQRYAFVRILSYNLKNWFDEGLNSMPERRRLILIGAVVGLVLTTPLTALL